MIWSSTPFSIVTFLSKLHRNLFNRLLSISKDRRESFETISRWIPKHICRRFHFLFCTFFCHSDWVHDASSAKVQLEKAAILTIWERSYVFKELNPQLFSFLLFDMWFVKISQDPSIVVAYSFLSHFLLLWRRDR